jgi:catecholate siderophore receptor
MRRYQGQGVTARAGSSRRRSPLKMAALAGAAGLSLAPGLAPSLAHAEGGEGLVIATAAAADAADASDAEANTVASVNVKAQKQQLDLSASPTTVQDTPQTVQVIGQDELRAKGVSSLEQALRSVPGITIAIGEGGTLSGDQFKIRGFDAKDDVYVDGLRDFGVYSRDSFPYEEVQVLKGPSGALFGRGSVGGAINTVSKKPHVGETESTLDVYAGSASYVRVLADVNLPLGEETALRINLMGQSNHVVDRDVIQDERWGAALALGLGLGTDTTLNLNYVHQNDDRVPDYGIVIVQKPGDLVARPASSYRVGVDRSTFTGFTEDTDRTQADIVTARLSKTFGNGLVLTNDSRVGVYSRYFAYTTTDQCNAVCTANLFDGNPATVPNGGMGGGGPYDMDAWGAQNLTTLKGEFELGGLRNLVIAGMDVSYQSNDKTFSFYTLPAGIAARNLIPRNLTDPDRRYPAGYAVYHPTASNVCPVAPRVCTATATSVLTTSGDATDFGVFLTDRLWLTDEVSLIGSVRWERYNARFDSTLVNGTTSRIKSKSDLVSPRLSLVWEPAEDRTVYLTWGRSETPQGTSVVGAGTALTLTARDLEPEEATTWELGAKLGLLDGRLNLSGAIFDVRKDNATQVDPGTGFLLAQSGEKQEVKGLELGATAQVTPDWSVALNYAYLDSETLESFTNCSATTLECPTGVPAGTPTSNPFIKGRPVIFTPKNSGSLYTTLDLDSLAAGLSAGGGVTYQSAMPVRYTVTRVAPAPSRLSLIAEIPESVSLDAYVAWQVGDWRVAVNGYNLTDRLNYSQAFGNRGVPAAGRTFVLSLGKRF